MDDGRTNHKKQYKTRRLCIELKEKKPEGNSKKKFLVSKRRKIKSKEISLELTSSNINILKMEKELFKRRI